MAEGKVTVDQMWNFFVNGAVGTKEFRNWLAKQDSDFAEIRDADVDNEIDRIARERAERQREDAEEE